jgi:hypothetical protein
MTLPFTGETMKNPKGKPCPVLDTCRVDFSQAKLGRKITEIFNFESRERLIITENLKPGAETLGQPEKFETLGEAVITRAEAARNQLGRKTFKL